MRSIYNAMFVLMVLHLSSCSGARTGDEKRPNIIIILADDMGYSDLGCTGSEIETPSLDALANQGTLFTHCYNTSRCCPTRASLLTGLYQHQAGYGHMDSNLGIPSYQGRFREGVVTIAQLLQKEEYRTIMLGKWHLGHEKQYAPLARGFDRMYGIPKGGGVYFYPCIGRDRQVFLNDQQVSPDSSWYSTDAFTDYAIKFAQEAVTDGKPFFMYLAYIAPHFPLQAKQQDIEKYRGRYTRGYDYYRKERFQRQKKLGVVSANAVLSPSDFDDWSTVDRDQEDLKMAVYAAQVDCMDQNIGRLIDQLKSMRVFDETLILFLSDNGAVDVGFNDTPDAQIGSRKSWAAYGHSWGNVSNTPYRYYKRMTHEGGIKTPLIVHWPKALQKSKRIVHDPVHIIDIAPSLLEICDISYPETFDGDTLMSLEGSDFLSKGVDAPANRSLFWEHEGNKAVRIGDWKLVKRHTMDWELYNMNDDPTELNNLVGIRTQLADSLQRAWRSWAKSNQVVDWPVKRKDDE